MPKETIRHILKNGSNVTGTVFAIETGRRATPPIKAERKDYTMAETIETTDISAKLTTLGDQLSKQSDQLAKFAAAVVSALSGQPSSSAPAKRRGRPPKAVSVEPEVARVKEMHPLARQALGIIERRGRVTQTDLANEMKIERSAVEYHCLNGLIAEGKAVARVVKPGGVKTIIYYSNNWASFREG